MNNNFKPLRLTLASLFVVLVGWVLFDYGQHFDKAKITLIAVPADSSITVDGKPAKTGTIYLKPGPHTLSANRELFEQYTKQISVQGHDDRTIYLLPLARSDGALKYLIDHPTVQAQREAYGSEQDQIITSDLSANSPIIKLLPHTDEFGPYSLNYGLLDNNAKSLYLIVNDSSPEGRTAALKWIRGQGYDPTDFNIVYKDFTNPFAGSDIGALNE